MKKRFFILCGLFSFLFASCSLSTRIEDIESNSNSETQQNKLINAEEITSAEYQASDTPNIIEVQPDTAYLKISGLSKGKKIWLSKTNPTKNIISSDYTRFINYGENISFVRKTSVSRNISEESEQADLNENHPLHPVFNTEILLEPDFQARSVATTSTTSSVDVNNYSIGDSKTLFIDTKINKNNSTFKQQNAILRAKGEYCYVWVVDEEDSSGDSKYWTSDTKLTPNYQKVNQQIVEKIADAFDKIYPMVRKVFGEESNQLIYQGKNLVSMDMNCDTGTMVNIVIYDLNNDFNSKDTSAGYVGYFHSKDYYKSYSTGTFRYSNAGKFFYIDAYYLANKTSMVYSTLAHEFQHMVDFGMKTMTTTRPLQSSTWYNEMKSMLCEDIMKNYLKKINPDFTDEDSPLYRLPKFCRHYFDVGLEYRSATTTRPYDDDYSYANNYAFGAWAARNYGGISFINKLATNNYVDIESIEDAAGVSITEMLKKYSSACAINLKDYGFNKDVSQTTFVLNSYSYPMDAINLWELDKILPELYTNHDSVFSSKTSSVYSFNGPAWFYYDTQAELRPYGFTISIVGMANDSEILLGFNTTKISTSQKVYVIID